MTGIDKLSRNSFKQMPKAPAAPAGIYGRKTIALLALIIVFGMLVRVNFSIVESRSPDEYVYTNMAQVISAEGPQGCIRLVDEYNSDDSQWLFPPPTRVGYLIPLAAFMRATNNHSFEAGTAFSLLFSVLSLVLLAYIGVRYFNTLIAITATALLCVSPMDLAISRRVWSDSFFGFLGLLVMAAMLEMLTKPVRRRAYFIFLFSACLSVTIKESGALLLGLGAAIILFYLAFVKRDKLRAMIFLSGAAICLIVVLAAQCQMVGGFARFSEVMMHIKQAMPTNNYAIEYQSGPWYNYLAALTVLSPFSLYLCLAGVLFVSMDTRGVAGRISDVFAGNAFIWPAIMIFTAGFISIASVTPYCQNLRYISPLYGPICLMAGTGAWLVKSKTDAMIKGRILKASANCALAILFLVGMLGEYMRFDKMIFKTGIKDISVGLIRGIANDADRT